MCSWHHDWKTDIGLRLGGLTLCSLSYVTTRLLVALPLVNGHLPQGALPFILAAAAFSCASIGTMLLTLGHHVFDEIEVSGRW